MCWCGPLFSIKLDIVATNSSYTSSSTLGDVATNSFSMYYSNNNSYQLSRHNHFLFTTPDTILQFSVNHM